MPTSRERRRLLLVGLGALAVGVAFYAIIRGDTPNGLSVMGFSSLGLASEAARGALGFIPSFVHVVAFTLITAAFLPQTRVYWFACAVAWASVNTLFECGQLPTLSWSAGYFDAADIAAAWLGACAALVACVALTSLRQSTRR